MKIAEEKMSVSECAKRELAKELTDDLVRDLKIKMKDLYLTNQVVMNIEREIADMELEIDHKLKGF